MLRTIYVFFILNQFHSVLDKDLAFIDPTGDLVLLDTLTRDKTTIVSANIFVSIFSIILYLPKSSKKLFYNVTVFFSDMSCECETDFKHF